MRGRISQGRGVVVIVGAARVVLYIVLCTLWLASIIVLSCNGRPLGAQDLQVPENALSHRTRVS